MKGCDRCGHRKKDHYPYHYLDGTRWLCEVFVGNRYCGCPKYLRPGTMA